MAKKQKKSAVGIFFSFFLKAVVIILGLVILAMGAYLVKYTLTASDEKEEKQDDSVLVDGDEDDLFETVTDASDSEDDESLLFDEEETAGEDLPTDAKIVVLNGSEVSGVAGAWKDKFVEAGFTNVDVGNYSGEVQQSSKIVVTEEGTGGNLANVLDAPVEFGEASSVSCDVSTDGVKAFIIVGNSDTSIVE